MNSYPFPQNMIDVPGSLGDYNVNGCDTDVSFSVWLPIPRCVSYSLSPVFGYATHCPCWLYAMVAHRNTSRQANELRWRSVVLPHPFSLLACRWPYIRPTSNPPRHMRIILLRISLGQPHVKSYEKTDVAGDRDMERGCYKTRRWKTGREPCLYLGVRTVTVYVLLSFVWTWTCAYILLWTDGLPLWLIDLMH